MPEESASPTTPPPTSYSTPPVAAPRPQPDLEFVADKIGFLPNARKSDNVLQAKIIGGVVLLTMVVAVIFRMAGDNAPFYAHLLLGALAGLIPALLISGLVIGIIGLRRK